MFIHATHASRTGRLHQNHNLIDSLLWSERKTDKKWQYSTMAQSLCALKTYHSLSLHWWWWNINLTNLHNVSMMFIWPSSHLLLLLLFLSHLFQANLLGLFSLLGFSLKITESNWIKWDVTAALKSKQVTCNEDCITHRLSLHFDDSFGHYISEQPEFLGTEVFYSSPI